MLPPPFPLGVAIAANIFTYVEDDYDFETQSATTHRYITEVVMDKKGTVVSYYHKHWLFPSETMVEPGPFSPTVFDMFGERWGIVICWEGFRADIGERSTSLKCTFYSSSAPTPVQY